MLSDVQLIGETSPNNASSAGTTQSGAVAWSPDGKWLVVLKQGSFFRVARSDGESVRLSAQPAHAPNSPRFSRDGQSIYYSVNGGPRENHGIWALSLRDGTNTQLTKLQGMRGNLGYDFTADARYLYITWRENDGEIWVMDVAGGNAK